MLDRIKRILGVDIKEQSYYEQDYDVKSIGNIVIPEKLTDKNAFTLANSVAELFFPIDFHADRISKLRFYIANKSGMEYPNSELNRFLTEINPLYSFSDLVYQYVFSLLADGNASNYVQAPSAYSGSITVNTINRWDVLRPDFLCIDEYTNLSSLEILNYEGVIKKAEYSEGTYINKYLNIPSLKIHNYSSKKRLNSLIFSKSPQFSANKSIDTLLSVYSARYNVYANNGAAGYLAKRASSSTNQALETMITDDGARDKILKDINSRMGLTGRRNIWGISGVPIEFVKTLSTISELMPFDETLESSIKIAGVFQIPSVLVPRKDQSTFDNQADAERNVWENSLFSLLSTVCENLTKLFGIDKTGYKILADTSSVPCLVANESLEEDLITKKLANIEKIKSLNPEIDITQAVNEIFNEYGKER